MLNFLKSNDSLERNLREWYYRELVREMGQKEEPLAKDVAFGGTLDDLLKQAAGQAYSAIQKAEADEKLFGRKSDTLHLMSCWKAISLGKEIAKRNNWEVTFSGAPLTGYVCTVERKRG